MIEKILDRCDACHHGKWKHEECRICRDGLIKSTVGLKSQKSILFYTRRQLKEEGHIRIGGVLTRALKRFKVISLKLKNKRRNKSY